VVLILPSESEINDKRIMTSSKTPQDVLDAIEKLEDASDQGALGKMLP
jgi:hypothetical protein